MKVSVSIPDEDVQFLDEYAKSRGIESRSAAVHHAIGLLRISELGEAYEKAWQEWADSRDAEDWELVGADGLSD